MLRTTVILSLLVGIAATPGLSVSTGVPARAPSSILVQREAPVPRSAPPRDADFGPTMDPDG